VPVALGPVELANRLVIAPHTVNFGFVDGSPGDDYIAYMTRRAPGFGLTWVPIAAPDPLGRAEPAQPWLWDDRFIPGLARLVDALRACGTEPGLQINHAGRQTSPMLIDGETPVAPSPEPPRSIYTTVPRELTVVEISAIVEGYAAAARRAVAAGFRALGLHFAHGYLVHQFLSSDSNHRSDEYGGSLENRLRLAVEIVAAVRGEVGKDVAVDVKLNGSDFVPGGIEIDEAVAAAAAVLAHGADGISVSGGVYGSSPFNLLLPFDDQAFLPFAAAIRAATGAVVTAVGKIRTPDDAAAAVRAGGCDLIGVARAVMADPDWALKALGRVRQPVRPCLGTLDGCSERLRHFEPATCQVMPEVGRELRVVPRGARMRVAIVGAGPAGCEAAVYAAGLGDTVLLVDEGVRTGGALRLAANTPGGEPFGELADFYAAELVRLGVTVALGTRADAAILSAFAPDLVILATGARPDVPGIEGYESAPLAADEDVLRGEVEPVGRTVVLGAGRRALATALHCADRGAAVTVVDHDGLRPAYDASALMRRAYKQQLAARTIPVLPGPVIRLSGQTVVLADVELPADLVVLAVRLRSVRDATRAVPAGITTTVVGDAKEPRSIMDAIAEAREAVDQAHAGTGQA
jgi:2,4-dienoyl-CoA reductase-like NADH-dependent reductase (Old Yellow Enzyme family)/thioredoxin reductase